MVAMFALVVWSATSRTSAWLTMTWAGYVGPTVLMCPPFWSSSILQRFVHGLLRGSVNVANSPMATQRSIGASGVLWSAKPLRRLLANKNEVVNAISHAFFGKTLVHHDAPARGGCVWPC